MSITISQKRKILQVVNVFETGKPEGDYANISLYKDGPKGPDGDPIRQITYGRSQTTEFGNLKTLLKQYVDASGMFAQNIAPFVPKMGKLPSLSGDTELIKILKKAGKEDPIMVNVQDSFFDSLYYQPAFSWFSGMKFTLPLSLLIIYDSFIHSGGVPVFLRERFVEAVPKNGGDEKSWVKAYTDTRHQWLSNHSRPLLRKTTYRTICFKNSIQDENWNLAKLINANGTLIH